MIEPVDPRKSNCNKKHLTLEQRKKILEGIKGHYNQEMISKDVGVHKTTVSREILSHRKYVVNHRKSTNRCESVSECKISHICENMKCFFFASAHCRNRLPKPSMFSFSHNRICKAKSRRIFSGFSGYIPYQRQLHFLALFFAFRFAKQLAKVVQHESTDASCFVDCTVHVIFV